MRALVGEGLGGEGRNVHMLHHAGVPEESGTAAVEGADTARKIQSVERVLCSQSLASPPATACGAASCKPFVSPAHAAV
jgi:hypothetical protein